MLCQSLEQVEARARDLPSQAIVIDIEAESSLEKYNNSKMGQLIVISRDGKLPKELELPKNCLQLLRPLSEVKLREIFEDLFPNEALDENRELDPDDQAALAAQISAQIYSNLLTLEALRQCRWQETSEIIANEVFRICRGLD